MRSLPGVLALLLGLFSLVPDARATSDGLIAHWRLDETSGTTASDGKGGNDGTLVNGPTWTTGHIGGAVDFDGTDDYVDAGDLGNAVDNISALTVALWVRQDALTTAMPIAKYTSADEHFRFKTVDDGSGHNKVGFDLSYNNGGYTQNPVHSAGVWEHWVAVFDGTGSGNSGRLKIFVNGAEQALNFDGTIPANTLATDQPLRLGTEWDGSPRWPWNGLIDDVRIYNRALSAAEVLELYNTKYCAAPALPESVMFYNACCKTYQFCNGTDWVSIGSAPHCTSGSLLSNLVAHWKLDESSGTTAEDFIGTNDGTLTGNGVTWQSTGGKVNGALQLGGTYDYVLKTGATGLPALRSNLTISAWYYLTTTPVNWGYVVSLNNPGSNATTRLGISNTGEVAIGKYGASTGIINSVAGPSLNAWHLYTYTFDGTTNRLYIDGAQAGSSTNLPDNATPDRVYIGYDGYQSDATQFTGLIDDVRIYDRALSAAEVEQIYNGTDMCP